ncbi:CpcT/CpeT family chromophore lyase [Aliidiomarina indica]|uniref:CpcT/CpeT family chromophore lyase n=1 Tax=Aliidiomarina indica TaxID=2749147 RepID=UPI0018902DC8|nr:CpcT/CpeT family chromophore lyase [Aliidiomarina indica]
MFKSVHHFIKRAQFQTLCLLGIAIVTVSAPTVSANAQRNADIDQLKEYLIGDFSNLRHMMTTGEGVGQPPVLLQITPAEWDGEQVLIARQALVSAPNEPYRIQVYRIRKDQRSGQLVQDIYVASPALNSSEHSLLFESAERLAGCSIRWRVEAGQFVGIRDGRRCKFRDQHGREISMSSRLLVTAEQLIIEDSAMAQGEDFILGRPLGEVNVYEPIRFMSAQIMFLPSGGQANDESAWLSVDTYRPLHDHDVRIPLVASADGMFIGHDIQLLGFADDETQLQLRIYRFSDAEPLDDVTMEFDGETWHAETERFRIQLVPVAINAL